MSVIDDGWFWAREWAYFFSPAEECPDGQSGYLTREAALDAAREELGHEGMVWLVSPTRTVKIRDGRIKQKTVWEPFRASLARPTPQASLN